MCLEHTHSIIIYLEMPDTRTYLIRPCTNPISEVSLKSLELLYECVSAFEKNFWASGFLLQITMNYELLQALLSTALTMQL